MNRIGRQTIAFAKKPRIRAASSTVGSKEGAGPYGGAFDIVVQDDLLGQNTWELAEAEMQRKTVEHCLAKGGLTVATLDVLLAGDLLNQITASGFAARQLGTPFLGLYGACSTMVEALNLGATLIDGGYRKNAVCAASSHFCAAERQYRFPLELGNQRPPSSQRTATAAGAILLDLGREPGMARVACATIGRVIDYQIKDANHMGAAMAPAVADTLRAHCLETNTLPEAYDLIVTGDLGIYGREILLELLKQRGISVAPDSLFDCGANLYDPSQDAHAGASGCGCIASMLAAHFLPRIASGEIKRLLALGSGAMLSPTSTQQGQSIPCISYAVELEAEK